MATDADVPTLDLETLALFVHARSWMTREFMEAIVSARAGFNTVDVYGTEGRLIARVPGAANASTLILRLPDAERIEVEPIEGGPERIEELHDELEPLVAPTQTWLEELLERTRIRREQSRRAIVQLTHADLERLYGLPADYQVVSMFEAAQRSSLCFVVRGPGLPYVAPGSEMPILNGTWNEIPLRVPKTEDNAELVATWLTDDEGEYTIATRFEWRPW